MNNDVQRKLMIFIVSSFFAGMLVSTASAQSPRETGNDTKATLEAKGNTVSDVPASHDLNSLKQDHSPISHDLVQARFSVFRVGH